MRPKTVRVVAAVAAHFFNDIIEMGVFYVRWNGKKRRILTIMVSWTGSCGSPSTPR